MTWRIHFEQSTHRQHCSTITQQTTMGGSVIDTSIDTHSTFTQTHSILSNTHLNAAQVDSRSASHEASPSLSISTLTIHSRFWHSDAVHLRILIAYISMVFKLSKPGDFFRKCSHKDKSQCQALISKQQAVPALCFT